MVAPLNSKLVSNTEEEGRERRGVRTRGGMMARSPAKETRNFAFDIVGVLDFLRVEKDKK